MSIAGWDLFKCENKSFEHFKKLLNFLVRYEWSLSIKQIISFLERINNF